MTGPLALIGGGEWSAGCSFDAELLAAVGADEVVLLPTAYAFENPRRHVERATAWFAELGVKVAALDVLQRADAHDDTYVAAVRGAKLVYLAGDSPMHLRSVLKSSPLYEAMLDAFRGGAVIAASGAAATVLCDPMVDPRGGAYTVGLGFVGNLAVFPYHGTAADHMRERSIDLLPAAAKLVGIDEETALVLSSDGAWRAAGAGTVTVYTGRDTTTFASGQPVTL